MRIRAAAVVLATSFLFPVFAQKQEMTWEQYLVDLNAVVLREKTAREQIASEQARIESLRQQINQLTLRIASIIQDKYTILGITEQDVKDAENELVSMKATLQQCAYLSNDDLRARQQELEQVETRFNALKARRVALLYRVAERVRDVEPLVTQVLGQLRQVLSAPPPAPVVTYTAPSTYTVGRNGAARSLSQIAAELYGDQHQWPRIYRANKAIIDKWYDRYRDGNGADARKIRRPQDFVLRGWTLEIPR